MRRVRLRFYIDPETDEPHLYGHDVDEEEVEDVLRHPDEDRQSDGSSRIALGRTRAGRHLRVIYVRDPEPQSFFIVTAYELRGKTLAAFKRRLRRHPRR